MSKSVWGGVFAAWVFLCSLIVAPPALAQFAQQGSKLTSTETSAQFGNAISLSGDGNTALIGGQNTSPKGAAWIFTRSSNAWSEHVELTPSVATDGAQFGASVAISTDGSTAIVGAPSDNTSIGAAFVFVNDGSGNWSEQAKLSNNTGITGLFGSSVALSSDGNTIAMGAPDFGGGVGRVYVSTRSAGVWTTPVALTIPSGPGVSTVGTSVALSADGNTLLIGAPLAQSQLGAGWVFVRDNQGNWSQENPAPLTAINGHVGSSQQGSAVALSADGNTALLGAKADDSNNGAAWVFTRDGDGTWTEGPRLATSDTQNAAANFGASVALSASGNTALIGAPDDIVDTGSSFVFTRDGAGNWTQYQKLLGTPPTTSKQGFSVALSSSGTTGLVGAPVNASSVGAVWAFERALTITGISPNTGPAGGGSAITISGTGLTGVNSLTFDGVAATNVVVVNATTITATTPAHALGTVDVMVSDGTDNYGDTSGYSYASAPAVTSVSPSAGPAAGGAVVTITGTDLLNTAAVTFGATPAAAFTVNSATQITATAPAHAAGFVDIGVTTPSGTSATGAGDQFTYVQAPAVTAVSPTAGPAAGGTSVTITGTNFTGATAVLFGGSAATGLTVDSDTQITVTAPAHAAATIDVTVTTAGGTSATGVADQFTYIPAPAVSSISPAGGPLAGGTSVTITGTDFTGATAVTFGGSAATNVSVVNATTITATTPAHAAGAITVSVTTPGGTGSKASGYTYAAAPTVTSVTPAAGPLAGGTSVTVTGADFTGATAVTFGGSAATNVSVVNATTITAKTPGHAAGAVTVSVTTSGGTGSKASSYTYGEPPTVSAVQPNSAPVAGNTTVTITGTKLTGATAVTFGGTAATNVSVVNDTTITVKTPAHAAGGVDVNVTTPGGTGTLVFGFAYFPLPTITSINPNQGPASGGTLVSIIGTNLIGVTGVKFGDTAATSFSASDLTHATATAPPHDAGPVNVTATTPGGTSEAGGGNAFTYEAAPKFTVLATFKGGKNDGGKPFGALVADKKGVLYGTTSIGGAANKGTVFSLTPPPKKSKDEKAKKEAAWKKVILFSFAGADGATPYAGVAFNSKGDLIGTTTEGGANNKGVVFKLAKASGGWTQSVLHDFQGGKKDGATPYAGVVLDKKGKIYGVTTAGGAKSRGTVFRLSGQTVTVLHDFTGKDGDEPHGALTIDAKGNLFGTTVDGGSKNGVLFELTTKNKQSVLHALTAGDGTHPYGGLLSKDGALYGATSAGGVQSKGTLFRLSGATYNVLFAFGGTSGANPFTGVVAANDNTLFGVTLNGGATNHGAVFQLVPPANGQSDWSQSVMYSFKATSDGAAPYGALLLGQDNGLYGTTSAGGSKNCSGGCGVVFKIER